MTFVTWVNQAGTGLFNYSGSPSTEKMKLKV